LDLLIQAELRHNQLQAEIESQKIRVNAKGGGRKPILSIHEQICLCLFYLRHYPTFEVLGIQFGVSKTEANNTMHYWLHIFRVLLPASLLDEVEISSSEHSEIQEYLEQFELIVDSLEQARERPGDNEEQKKYFSGKKKQHTFKSQIITLPKGKDIVDVVAGKKGPTSDINIFKEQESKFSCEQEFVGDKGYVGANNVQTPHKKPRGGELTEEQKEQNKELSSTRRIFVEHVIKLLRIFRVTQEKFRLNPSNYERIIFTVCGLIRLRLGMINLSVST
jgi:DDE superfamily endonuclease/Helix-turn-helix of DDE superfamily endonuclease